MSELFERIAALGRVMDSDDLGALVDKLQALGNERASAAQLRGLAQDISHRATNERVRAVFHRWQEEHADVPPVALAWALRAARATADLHRQREHIQLIWTDPRDRPTNSRFRRIDQALLEVIEAAEDSITIVSYATHRVRAVQDALLAKPPSVRITFIVESAESSDGGYDRDPRSALQALAQRVTILTWPLARRDRTAGQTPGVLHAKCAIVDDRRLLISSANLTARALQRNIELGLLIEGGDMPKQLSRHLDALRSDGFFQPIEG